MKHLKEYEELSDFTKDLYGLQKIYGILPNFTCSLDRSTQIDPLFEKIIENISDVGPMKGPYVASLSGNIYITIEGDVQMKDLEEKFPIFIHMEHSIPHEKMGSLMLLGNIVGLEREKEAIPFYSIELTVANKGFEVDIAPTMSMLNNPNAGLDISKTLQYVFDREIKPKISE